MNSALGPEDIARITQAVVQKLSGTKVDSEQLKLAVQKAAQRELGSAQPSEVRPDRARPESPSPSDEARNRVIVASFGKNRPGIVAAISNVLAEELCSIEDMSQRIMQEFYTLIMIVDITGSKADFAALSAKLKAVEDRLGVTILAQHEDVFRYMHRV
jgi:ACT domain-containing protein